MECQIKTRGPNPARQSSLNDISLDMYTCTLVKLGVSSDQNGHDESSARRSGATHNEKYTSDRIHTWYSTGCDAGTSDSVHDTVYSTYLKSVVLCLNVEEAARLLGINSTSVAFDYGWEYRRYILYVRCPLPRVILFFT